jgi:acetate kinase
MRVLVVNAGSSSLKLRLLGPGDAVEQSADLPIPEGIPSGAVPHPELASLLGRWARPDVVGHRIVHGGNRFRGPALINTPVRAQLGELTDLAPLHQPKSLAALDAVSQLMPGISAVASFDTAFHATIPPAAATYALPREWRDRYGLRKFGFHGLSHAYAARRAAALLDRDPQGLRLITCHLGAGGSVAAVVDGRSVDTTMGFTPLDGLVMATRSGSIDPGLVLWLEEHEHLSPRAVATALETESGLRGLGGTSDMREIEARAGSGDQEARLAFDVYVHSLVAGVGAMTASAGGVDALVFTGGVGERSAGVRREAVARLKHLGLALDPPRNESAEADADITASGARASTLVIAAREDLQIAREARRVVRYSSAGSEWLG